MTKIDGRTKNEAATQQLDESLRAAADRLIDLVQHHEIIRFEDPHRIFDEEGAQAALLDAQQAGKLRYIGFTGHKDPRIHLHMLEVAHEHGFTFDAVQMPLNVMDAHYRSFERLVLPEFVRAEHRRARHEEPGERAHPAVGHRHGRRVPALRAEPADLGRHHRHRKHGASRSGVRTPRTRSGPLSEADVTALLAKTATAAARGEFELFKTTSIFDGTATNPAWLGDEPEHVQAVMPE